MSTWPLRAWKQEVPKSQIFACPFHTHKLPASPHNDLPPLTMGWCFGSAGGGGWLYHHGYLVLLSARFQELLTTYLSTMSTSQPISHGTKDKVGPDPSGHLQRTGRTFSHHFKSMQNSGHLWRYQVPGKNMETVMQNKWCKSLLSLNIFDPWGKKKVWLLKVMTASHHLNLGRLEMGEPSWQFWRLFWSWLSNQHTPVFL